MTLASGGSDNPHVDETTALLAEQRPSEDAVGEEDSSPQENDEPPEYYNRYQVIVLSICALVDPISFFCIVPFVPQMIYDLGGIEKSKVGFYAGLIESLFSIVQMLTLVPWGRAADKFGRKPVLTTSLLGLLITASLFGFSQNLWQMIALRCAAGLFSGSVVAIRSMISENSSPKSQAMAFSLFSFFRNIGIFAGTFIGGFAKPAEQYESVFGGIWFFERFPFALPTMITGVCVFCAFLLSIFVVRETLDVSKLQHSRHNENMSLWEVLNYEGVAVVLWIFSIVGLLGFSFTAVAPVFFWTPVELGGFGLTTQMISLLLMLAGISQAMWTLLVFPRLQRRIGTGGVLRVTAVAWPICFALNPIANLVLKKHMYTAFKVLAPIVIISGSGCSMAFTAVQLTINDISPSQATLGTLNGVALSVSSGVRAFAPGLFTSIYAKGVDDQILAGELIWVVLIAITLTYGASLFWLPKRAEGIRR